MYYVLCTTSYADTGTGTGTVTVTGINSSTGLVLLLTYYSTTTCLVYNTT